MPTARSGPPAMAPLDPPAHGRRRPSAGALRRFGLIVAAWTAFGLLLAAQTQLQLGVRSFAVLNLVLVVGWLGLAGLVLREHRRLAAAPPPA